MGETIRFKQIEGKKYGNYYLPDAVKSVFTGKEIECEYIGKEIEDHRGEKWRWIKIANGEGHYFKDEWIMNDWNDFKIDDMIQEAIDSL